MKVRIKQKRQHRVPVARVVLSTPIGVASVPAVHFRTPRCPPCCIEPVSDLHNGRRGDPTGLTTRIRDLPKQRPKSGKRGYSTAWNDFRSRQGIQHSQWKPAFGPYGSERTWV